MCFWQRRAVNVAVQTGATEPSVSNRWSMSDVRMSEAKRISGCAFSSPLANNNEAIPSWRPPATGSSQRQGSHYYRLQKSSQRQKHRNHRQVQRQYYREAQQREEDDCQHYPLRRSRPASMMPSIQIQSPSSSESYSILAMSTHSKSAAISKWVFSLIIWIKNSSDIFIPLTTNVVDTSHLPLFPARMTSLIVTFSTVKAVYLKDILMDLRIRIIRATTRPSLSSTTMPNRCLPRPILNRLLRLLSPKKRV